MRDHGFQHGSKPKVRCSACFHLRQSWISVASHGHGALGHGTMLEFSLQPATSFFACGHIVLQTKDKSKLTWSGWPALTLATLAGFTRHSIELGPAWASIAATLRSFSKKNAPPRIFPAPGSRPFCSDNRNWRSKNSRPRKPQAHACMHTHTHTYTHAPCMYGISCHFNKH
jgi:hypothetical protein